MLNSKYLKTATFVAALMAGGATFVAAQDAAQTTTPAATATEQPVAKPGALAALKAKFGGRKGGFGGVFGPDTLAQVDSDNNAAISQDEVNAFRTAKVTAADTTKDGALSLDEFSVAYNEMMRARMVDAFQKFDDDGNGSITTAELDTRFGSIVAQMDRNGDGVLSAADRPDKGGKKGKRQGQNNDQRDRQDN